MYFHLFEIAIYLWFGSIADTTEFQFAFCGKINCSYSFVATNSSVRGTVVTIVSFATAIWSCHTTLSLKGEVMQYFCPFESYDLFLLQK